MPKLLLTLLFLLSCPQTKENIYGKVVGITDGDTIIVLTDSRTQLKVRLEGIDCPESGQDFGEKARQATADLCFKQAVKLVKSGEDRYGRTLAFVYVGNMCVNKELLSRGMAWHFKKYNKDPELARLENEARMKKTGLWSMPHPVPPWDYRKRK